MNKTYIKIDGMFCNSCHQKVKNILKTFNEINSFNLDTKTNIAQINFNDDTFSITQVIKAINELGYDCEITNNTSSDNKNSFMNYICIFVICIAVYIFIKDSKFFKIIPQIDSTMSFIMIFITGLLTSIHCVIMCGGVNISQCTNCDSKNKLKPSLFYNMGRVCSYSLIGALVGFIGYALKISNELSAIISFIAGIFMIIMGLNLSGFIKPLKIFLPTFVKEIKIHENSFLNKPFIVGFLNGFIPCGPLQAMQIYALGTGSAFKGAMSMFLFGLGTMPLMFFLGFMTNYFSSKKTKKVLALASITVVLLGIMSIERGFAFLGLNIFNFSNSSYVKSVTEKDVQTVVTSLDKGYYEPILLKSNIKTRWIIMATDKNLTNCNNSIVIPHLDIQKDLYPGENIIEFTPTEKGEFVYTCWMGMVTSKIKVSP